MALNVLASVARQKSAPAAARVSASVALLERGWGKPQQDVAIDAAITVTVRKLISENQNVIDHEPLLIEDDSTT